ncbi:Secreted thaumatin-like protein calA [Penicillium macrosclerotiorum]|uniref:Secreted thaumatin-like protein calA n=1 Tax=Penicillium macrosclerotiorum TaxID=303699 RepID=UPI0025473FFC|nr:Secreted thaumatin-like protein calA [Penicillium macrosclerotiorum]KAJ5692548.1 Secreted thaumatin-like protein calA [Penicillium macrosclerotiorum]
MLFSKSLTFFATLAATASALPFGIRDSVIEPTATTVATSTITLVPASSVSSTSSASASVTASSTASASTSTSTSGSVKIVNNLDKTVYLWSTSNESSSMKTLSSNGGTYSESWQTNSDGGGISIKMATTESEDSVLQFEYTKTDETIWWDLSSINLASTSEFISSGFAVTSDDSSCATASCSAGDTDCADSYQESDDVDTRSCSSSAAFTMTIG